MTTALSDAGRDLVLGSTCVGCATPGRPLCRACEDALPRRGRPAWPTPTPPGLAPPFAAGAYDGRAQGHGQRSTRSTRPSRWRPRSDGCSPTSSTTCSRTSSTPVLGHRARALVPVPSRPRWCVPAATTRCSGSTRAAARRLRQHGVDARVCRLLVSRSQVADQSALGAAGTSREPRRLDACRRAAAAVERSGAGLTVVVDDVLTTGATAREAQRALEARRPAGARRRGGRRDPEAVADAPPHRGSA